jgi:hypothetical protein
MTLAIALLGAILGLINAWHSLNQCRVRLIVRPKRAIPFGAVDPRLTFCIEVTNLSTFAVTICDVGVFYKGTDQRGSIVRPVFLDGGPWPRRLEPRSAVTVYSQTPEPFQGHAIKCAYAVTECGVTKVGKSPALKWIARSTSELAAGS